jgi:MFS family permease
VFGAWGLTAAWTVIFFFASAGASSAYLTVSEVFPLETRALAIAFFYAVGTAIGGITGPLLFGKLVESEDVMQVMWGWILAAALMIGAGVVQAIFGVEAAQRDLEDVAPPISAQGREGEGEAEAAPEPAPRRRRGRVGVGPGRSQVSYAPYAAMSSRRTDDPDMNREVDEIVAALRAAPGRALARAELTRRVRCRTWGPGRFRRAMAEALGRYEATSAG